MRRITAVLCFAFALSAQTPPRYIAPDVQQHRLIHQVRPIYPELAKQARIQGVVRLLARIDETGAVEQLMLVDGPPLLVEAAMQAVRQWRYQPATRNSKPVPVITIVRIPFTIEFDPTADGPIVRV